MSAPPVILPGATLGILGGGQLGRMTAMAARSLGYRVRVMDPDPACSARFVVDSCIQGNWNNADAAAELARNSDVVTLEIEQVALDCLNAAAKFAPVRPGSAALGIIQDRILQKNWLREHGAPLGAYRAITSEAEMVRAAEEIGPRLFVKSARGGYDGRSQVKLGFGDKTTPADAWRLLGERPCVAEQAVDLEREISVMVARTPGGETRSFPSALNHHEHQILAWSVLPSAVDPALEAEAQRIARGIAESLALEGVLAVEMFVSRDGRVLVNELAPRPHNSYHASERACVSSQFEQLVRAVCNLPLGDTSIVQPTAIANLLGDLWLDEQGQPRTPHFDKALTIPGVRLHLYEKHSPRKGRKMGHLSAVAATPDEAVQRVLEAKQQL